MAIRVFSESYEEELVWSLAWMLASFTDTDRLEEFSEALDSYDSNGEPEASGFLFNQEGDEGYDDPATETRHRVISFVYEWMLMGHETSRICFQRFMEARLS